MDQFSYKDACFAWSKALCVCFPRTRRNNDLQQGHVVDDNDYFDRNDEFHSLLQDEDPESLSSILTRSPFSRKSFRKQQPRPSVDGLFHDQELQTEDAGMLPDESIQSFTKLVDQQVRQGNHVTVSHDDLFAEEEQARLQEEYLVQLNRSRAHKAALDRGLIVDHSPPPPFQQEEFVYPVDKPSNPSSPHPPPPPAPQTTSSLFNAPRLNSKQRAAFKRFNAEDDDSDQEEPAGFAEFFPFAGTHDETTKAQRQHMTRHLSSSSDESRDDSRSDSGSLVDDDDDAAKAAGDLGNGRDRIKSIYKVFTGM